MHHLATEKVPMRSARRGAALSAGSSVSSQQAAPEYDRALRMSIGCFRTDALGQHGAMGNSREPPAARR